MIRVTDYIAQTLNVEVKRTLVEILADQIFETEEDDMENDPDVLAEVAEARKAYQIGDYQTIYRR